LDTEKLVVTRLAILIFKESAAKMSDKDVGTMSEDVSLIFDFLKFSDDFKQHWMNY
jgi:hypothetical protein